MLRFVTESAPFEAGLVYPLASRWKIWGNIHTMDAKAVEHCVEILCEKGCTEVTRLIAAMERGETPAEAAALSAAERAAVLGELKSVMAVYTRAPR